MDAITHMAHDAICERFPDILISVANGGFGNDQVCLIQEFGEEALGAVRDWIRERKMAGAGPWDASAYLEEHLAEVDFGEIFMMESGNGDFFVEHEVRVIHDAERGLSYPAGSFLEWSELNVWASGEIREIMAKEGIEVGKILFEGEEDFQLDIWHGSEHYGKKLEIFDVEGRLAGVSILGPWFNLPKEAVSVIAGKHVNGILAREQEQRDGAKSALKRAMRPF